MRLSLAAAAAEAGRRPAVVACEETLTFAELAERTAPAAGWLAEQGVRHDRQGDSVFRFALVGTPELQTLLWLYALVDAGEPVVLLHPRWTMAERDAVLAAIPPLTLLPELPPGSRRGRPTTRPVPADERPLAVVFTSGTSGSPRGVVLSRRAFAAAAAASEANLGWQEEDRWLLALAPAHVGGLSILIRCLLARRCLVLPGARNAAGLARTMSEQRVTLVSLVPAMLAALLDLEPTWQPAPHLRAVLLGGAAASPRLLARAADLGIPVLTTYGLTECCSQVTTQRAGTVNRGELGAGPPLPGVELAIRADNAIAVRSPQLLSAYLPAHPEPLDPEGWLVTGDVGRLDAAGNLHVLGRLDDLIVTGGEKVAPLEVEAALLECPGVSAACVAGAPDPFWGQVVGALVVPAPGSPPLDLALVRGFLTRHLASYKHPRRLVPVAEIPLTAAGKPDRAAAARLLAGASSGRD